MTAPPTHPSASAWAPLGLQAYRSLWIAALASQVGTWMHDVAAAWVMTDLTPSPLVVALLGTASSLPLFLLALPAGALGDVVDRRRYLLMTQAWMAFVATALGVVTLLGLLTPALLLLLTFALGIGVAMTTPVWQALTPTLVPREQLSAAVMLSSISVNVSRAIGPAIGGFLLAATSPGIVFLVNAISYLGVIGVLAWWRPPTTQAPMPAERFAGAIRAGARYVRYAPEFRAVLLRAGLFILFGSGLWALLPVVGRRELGLDALGYGLLMGAVGVGAVGTAVVLPRVREKVAEERIVLAASVLFGGALLALAFVRSLPVLFAVMVVAGMGWIANLTSLNVAAQRASASWVRARSLAVYAIVFQGGIALGSAVWGGVASRFGTELALCAAGIGMMLASVATSRVPLPAPDSLDLTPSRHWPALAPTAFEGRRGPVLVLVEYRVPTANVSGFLPAVHKLERIRRRDGAFEWGVFRDEGDARLFVEQFVVDSWEEHVRQHERVTVTDRATEDEVRRLCDAVTVRHLGYAEDEVRPRA